MSAAPSNSFENEAARIAKALHGKRSGNDWLACCPAHEDHSPSLSIRQEGNRVLLKCHAHCTQEAVIDALREQGLWEPRPVRVESAPSKTFYVYNDEQGKPLHRTERKANKQFIQWSYQNGQWVPKLGPRRVLYHLDELIARSSETVYIPEGEKDVDKIRSLGYLSTCNTLGAGKWNESYTEAIRRRESREVVIFYDNDSESKKFAGQDHAQKVALSLLDAGCRVRIVDLPEGKDVSDYLALGHTKAELDALIAKAPYQTRKSVQVWRNGFNNQLPEASIELPVPGDKTADNWESELLTNKDHSPKACLANAITALTSAPEWDGVLAYNEFALTTVALKPTPWNPTQKSAEWKGADDIRLNDWLQHQGIMVNLQVTGQAVQAVAERQKLHPVRQFLNSLQWDGEKRLDDWLIRYLGVEATAYSRAVGAKWCISAVARIYKPGEKVDHCLILQGKQGKLKSTALRVLAVQPEWFTDELAEMGSKDSALQVAGVWIIELSELDSFGRAEMGRIKAFMSRQVDRFRPPYGARLTTAPRNCVFAGTVNESTFLKDATGARRFWTLKTGVIDIAGLKEIREQLWAEAVHRYRSGEKWWLDTDDLNEQARKAQSEHYAEGVWDERIAEWLLRPVKIGGSPLLHPYEEGSVSTEEILEHCIGKAPEKWTHSDQIAVSRAMTSKGWERFRSTFESESVNRPRRWRKCRE